MRATVDTEKDVCIMLAEATDMSPEEIIEETLDPEDDVSDARYNELHTAIEEVRS